METSSSVSPEYKNERYDNKHDGFKTCRYFNRDVTLYWKRFTTVKKSSEKNKTKKPHTHSLYPITNIK